MSSSRITSSSSPSTLTLWPDGSVLAGGKRPDRDTYQVVAEAGSLPITAILLGVGERCQGHRPRAWLGARAASTTARTAISSERLQSLHQVYDGTRNSAGAVIYPPQPFRALALTPLHSVRAVPELVLILLLYFLKLRRQPLSVPSTFLWRKSIEDVHVNSLFQWLRENLLLILQLLTAVVLTIAISAASGVDAIVIQSVAAIRAAIAHR